MTHRQLDIFGNDHPIVPEVSARATDPTSSHVTVRSLAKDGSSYRMILTAVCQLSMGSILFGLAPSPLVTDDRVVIALETVMGRRFQRNVIARSRGLLEPDYIKRIGVMPDDTGRSILHYVPTELAMNWFHNLGASS
jgi:hypothetical protein